MRIPSEESLTDEMVGRKEAYSRALVLHVQPPRRSSVCKLNPVTTEADLERE